MTPEFLAKIPTNADLEDRFNFIDNELLRSNVAIYFRYVIFLLALAEEVNGESLAYSLYKDIVVYTASIIESLLQYTVSREILLGKADKKVFGNGEKMQTLANISHECDELHESVLQVVKKTSYPKHGSSDRIDFKDITLAAKRAGILTDPLYKAAEELRTKRNTIHISTLTKSSDDYFKKSDIEAIFKNAHDIILSIEKCYELA